ncbi:MAG TPA: hypothetical protein VKC34_10520 [Blastocatellia bacterium]|nr:hypothetical protein [Blastocatellia bacterium]
MTSAHESLIYYRFHFHAAGHFQMSVSFRIIFHVSARLVFPSP